MPENLGITLITTVQYGAQLVSSCFFFTMPDDVSFLWHTFFFRHDRFFGTPLFFGTTIFFGTTFFLGHDCFFRQVFFFGTNFFFSARPGQVTADQYYCSGMVIATVVQILGTRLPCLFLLNTSRHAQFVTSAS